MKFDSWKGNLDRAFPELARVALGQNELNIVVLNDRVALGLPKNPALAEKVIRLYRPMKLKARIVTKALETLVKLGGGFLLKSRREEDLKAEIPWLTNEERIGFLGCNPAHGLRCVALSENEGESIKVTKIAIGGNLKPVVAEAEFLKEVSGAYAGIPKLGGSSQGNGWAAFHTDYVRGEGPCRFGGAEIDLLEGWLGSGEVVLGEAEWLKQLFAKGDPNVAELLNRQVVRAGLVHGDFTPWNLRNGENGLVAVDWEWARREGIGGLDLGHGLIMESVLVKGLSGQGLIDEVLSRASQPKEFCYLKVCGWEDPGLWLSAALLYSSHHFGVNAEKELSILKNRVGQAFAD